MSILTQLFGWFILDFRTTIFSLILGYVVYYLAKFYYRYYSLPPGPFPLPVLGNFLSFKTKLHWDTVLENMSKKYGPIFTVHFGNKPHIMITDVDIAREAFRKNDFAGRQTDSQFGSLLSNDKYKDVVFTDYGHTWEALRRVAHAAVQKYSTNERLVNVAIDSVDKTIQIIEDREGTDRQFSPNDYIYLMFLNILANSTFGQNYNDNDKEFKQILYILRDFNREAGTRLLLWELSPLFRLIYHKWVQKQNKMFAKMAVLMTEKLENHYKDYDENIERDFCDALISAKNDALREGKESAPYLTDPNLAITMFDLFLAGTDTSQRTFHWILLFMAYYPEMQKKLKEEIESQIGDRMPTHEDKQRCHYVMSFIAETMRLRNVVPSGVPHRAVVRSKIDKYTLEEDSSVLVLQGNILRNEKYWPKSQNFIPERFLDSDGHYITTRSPAFIPFGVGRRVCLGEKLAIADLFLVLVRFLQSTKKYDIVLGENNGIIPDPDLTDSVVPFEYKVIFKIKSQ